MKRFLASIIALAMLLSMAGTPVSALVQREKRDVVTFAVGSVEAEPDADVALALTVDGDYSASALTLYITFDSTKLSVVGSLTPGDVWLDASDLGAMTVPSVSQPGKIGFMLISPSEDFSGSGTIFTFRLHVSAEAEPGETIPLVLDVAQFTKDDYDGTVHPIEFTAENGSVTVAAPEPTEAPTEEPTEEPTEAPTEAPTEEPTEAPTEVPTEAPTEEPTPAPTAEPEPVLIAVGSAEAMPGADVTVPVTLSGEYSSNAMTLFVTYDPALLSVNGTLAHGTVWNEILTEGGTAMADVSAPGRIGFTAIVPDGVFQSSGELFTVSLHIAEDVPSGTVIPLALEVQQFTFDALDGTVTPLPHTDADGSVMVSVPSNLTFTVTFTVNGEVYTTAEYHYGEAINVPDYSVPAGYTFSGWDVPAAMPAYDITVDATLTLNTYTVTWANEDGTVLEVDNNVPYGAMPTYDGDLPVKPATAQFTYVFSGWTPELAPVTASVTYYACYQSALRTYTVTWYDDDGTVLETDADVPYGAMPTYDGETPVKPADSQYYTYVFAGWTPTIVPVAGDASYTATYDLTYTDPDSVAFAIDTVSAEPDSDVVTALSINGVYSATTLTVFVEYDPTYLTLDSGLVKEAIWQEILAEGGTVMTNTNNPGSIGFTAIVPDGAFSTSGALYSFGLHVSAEAEPGMSIPLRIRVESFSYDELDGNIIDIPFTVTSGAVNVYVDENRLYTVTYTVNGEFYASAEYHYGDAIVPPEYNVPTGYTFSGWTVPATMPAHDVTADASLTVNTYTVTWVNEDGTLLETDLNVPYGTLPTYDGAVPVKPGSAQYTYTFAGWTPEIAPVTASITYTAVYTASVNTYTVTWYDDDGSVLETDYNVPYGTMPAYDGATPSKPSLSQFYYYEFAGWDPTVVSVTGDASYTAVYNTVYVNPDTVAFAIDTVDAEPGSDVTLALTLSGSYSATVLTVFVEYDETYLSLNGSLIKGVIWQEIQAEGGTVLTNTASSGSIGFTAIVPDGAFSSNGALYTFGMHVSEDAVPGVSLPLVIRVEQFTYDDLDGTIYEIPITVTHGAVNVNIDENRLFTVTYTINGEPYTTAEYHYGEAIIVPEYTVPAGYTFSGWNVPAAMPAHDITVDASLVLNRYTVTWLNEDGSVLETDYNVPYGTMPSYDGATPVKPGSAQYTYTFVGWTPELAPVTASITYIAVFESHVNTYIVTWYDDNGAVLETDYNVPYGTMPSFDGATPVKPAPSQYYTYVFAGWTPTVVPVTGDAAYTAVYDLTYIAPESVAFAIDTVNAEPGSNVTVSLTLDGVYSATALTVFVEYDTEYLSLNGSLIRGAIWQEILAEGGTVLTNTNDPGSIGFTAIVPDGVFGSSGALFSMSLHVSEHAEPGMSIPLRIRVEQFTYDELDGSIIDIPFTVTSGAVNVFIDPNRLFTVTFTVNGDVYATAEYHYGDAITVPEYNVPAGYTFSGWDVPATMPAYDITVDATLTVNTYTITWVNDDGAVLETDYNVPYGTVPSYNGATPTKPATAQYTYTFAGWSPEVAPVTGSMTYIAVYTATINTYTVTWVNEDGTVLEVDNNVPFGTVPTYNGTAPSKPATAQYTYTFAGWSPTVVPVNGNATYTATYSSTLNAYTVTWLNYDGAELEVDYNVHYGTTPTYNGATPARPATAQYTYTFAGWEPAVTAVTGDAVYTAVFTATPRSYTVTYNINGEYYATQTYYYGDAITVPAYTVPEGYTFSGWNVPATMPAQNITVNATLTANTYTVTYTVNGEFYTVQTYYYGEAITVPAYSVPVGYTFSGWNVPATMPAQDITVNATLTANIYTVTYTINGEFYAEQTYTYGQEIVPPAYTVPVGYTFGGWTVPAAMPAQDITVNATLTANTYTVTYTINGEYYAAQTYTYGSAIVPPAYDVPEGYSFSGWNVPATMPAQDITVNAALTANTYTVTYLINGEFYAEQTYAYGAVITPPEFTVPSGYTFSGWNVPATMPAHDITVDAELVMSSNAHTVTFIDGYNGEVIAVYLVEDGEDAPLPELPDHGWYVFDGWDGDYTNITEDTVITATYWLLGDADHDGTVTSLDALIVLRYVLTLINELDEYVSDVNRDGVIDSLDALLILRYAMGLIQSF